MVRFSEEYCALLEKSGEAPGRYLSVPAAEWFQGRGPSNPVSRCDGILQDCRLAGRRKIQWRSIWVVLSNSGRKL